MCLDALQLVSVHLQGSHLQHHPLLLNAQSVPASIHCMEITFLLTYGKGERLRHCLHGIACIKTSTVNDESGYQQSLFQDLFNNMLCRYFCLTVKCVAHSQCVALALWAEAPTSAVIFLLAACKTNNVLLFLYTACEMPESVSAGIAACFACFGGQSSRVE